MKNILWLHVLSVIMFSAFIVDCSGGADKYGNTRASFSGDDDSLAGSSDWGDSDDDESRSAAAVVDSRAAFWGTSATWDGAEGIDLDSMVAAYAANPVGADADSEDEPGAVPASAASDLVDDLVESLGGLELEDDDKMALRKLRLLIKDLEHDLQKQVSDEKKLNLEEAQRLLANYALMIHNEIDLYNQMDYLTDDEVAAADLIDSKLNALTLNIDRWRVKVDRLTSEYEIMKSHESEDRPVIGAKRTKSRGGRGSSGGGGGSGK
jgi:hypothetical protein